MSYDTEVEKIDNAWKVVNGHPFKTKPFAHQMEAFNLSKDEKEFGLFMDMGTGKTKVAIDTAAYLYLKGEINMLVVFGNKGSYMNWIDNEIPCHLPDSIERFATHWEANPSNYLMMTYEMLKGESHRLKIFVMNIEAIAYSKAYKVVESIIKANRCLIVVDESTTIKNENAARTKAAISLGLNAGYRRILTGEPVANSPMDIWAQAKFLNPVLLGFHSFYSFRAYYGKMKDIRVGYRIIKKIDGYRNMKTLEANIAKWSYRIKKEDCLDLPPKLYQFCEVEFTTEQKKLYEKLRDESVAELSSMSMVTTTIAITKLLRLHQLVCGHLVDDLGNTVHIPNNRVESLMDLLEDIPGKVLIWVTYREDIKQITKAISDKYGPESVVSYFGDTTKDERKDAVDGIQDVEGAVRFFVGNPKTGGYGITLTGANTVIYYSNNFSLEVRLQSEDRAHRIGQTKAVTYIDMMIKDTVDEKIIKALRGKKKISSEVLGDEWQDWI